ncbi:methyltransferase domain-containing protein [Sphingobium sp. DEHP117]|uniref:class I SAM-dependent methyltransferase n=1 Tax=Sphingobium sp. DEHP117 TaxID=2993436 RepID=UPI0027D641A0|nr:methyltransferase domain-containing protein [Sphingobium sp. DEHP117]MDQ4419194.1 methyltransferase domain-containing protein [Sphingobium sp. DEHP117]
MHNLSEKLIFLTQFLRHPKMIGSVIPTSPRVVDALLSRVDWDETRLFVEYGPGLGTFTRPILARMRPDARLVAIDTNPAFVAHLRHSIVDSRLEVVHGSAADVEEIVGTKRGGMRADHILSGLPFSTLPSGVAELIAEAASRALKPGGSLLVYQYSSQFARFLEPWFPQIELGRVWKNVPPCVIAQANVAPAPGSARQVEAAGDLVIKNSHKKVA